MPDQAEQLDRLRTALATRYRIERELGRGGMATVYLADDLKHHRPVAVKVLRPELAAVIGPERFLREIEITARLDHPHILPLLDSGEAAGFLFYVMPYAAGESLRDRLNREQQLPLDDALRIAREMADALGFAHRHGVLHRDIKPENILLGAGHARVADFGIARAISAAAGERLTETGLAIGTPQYMSPEQATGQTVLDGRSDLYALGCVLYEMLTGQPPFEGATLQSLLARKAVETPPSVRGTRQTVSPQLDLVLAKSLSPLPADRFQSADALAGALERSTASSPDTASPVPPTKGRKMPGRVAFAAAAVTAVGVAGAIAIFMAREPRLPQVRSVAVLPIKNLTGDAAREPFVDGLTDVLTSEVAQLGDLVVKSTSSAMRFKHSERLLPEIGRALGADVLVEASLLHLGESVRFTVQLVHAAEDRHLWAESYDLPMMDLPAHQQRVAHEIARAIRLELAPEKRQALTAGEQIDPRAYELYVQGLQQWRLGGPDRRGAERSEYIAHLDTSISRLREAVDLEPRWAKAWARLAGALHWRASSLGSLGDVPHAERRPDYEASKAAAVRALEIDEENDLAHNALGFLLSQYEVDYAAAEEHYRRARELNPNSDTWAFALMLMRTGRAEEAVRYFSEARERNPLSWLLLAQTGSALGCVGRLSEADSAFQRALELDSTAGLFLFRFRGTAALGLGRAAEAIDNFEAAGELAPSSTDARLGYAYAQAGRQEEARQIIRNREAQGLFSPDIRIALGEVDRGLDEFQQEFEERLIHPRCYRPWYREYRDHPRVRRIVESVFPERQGP